MDKRNNAGISDVIEIKDPRYPVKVAIKTDAGEIPFLWYFNPAEMKIFNLIEDLKTMLENPEPQNEDYKSLNNMFEKMSELVDDIFGEKVSVTILRYCDFEYAFLMKVVEKIIEGYNDFIEKSEAAKNKKNAKARKEANETAKAEAAEFIAGKA